jgi:hypothetical protein
MSKKNNRHWKKIRGWKKKHRCEVKISDVTAEGFHLRTFNKVYYVSRDVFAWFLGASQRQIQNVTLFPCSYDDPVESADHGDWIRWHDLDIDLGSNDFEFPVQRNVYQAANVYREKYNEISNQEE